MPGCIPRNGMPRVGHHGVAAVLWRQRDLWADRRFVRFHRQPVVDRDLDRHPVPLQGHRLRSRVCLRGGHSDRGCVVIRVPCQKGLESRRVALAELLCTSQGRLSTVGIQFRLGTASPDIRCSCDPFVESVQTPLCNAAEPNQSTSSRPETALHAM